MTILVYITCGNRDEARKIAKILVKERLIACCNFFPIESIYSWEGKIEEEKEYLLLCKTTRKNYNNVEKRVKDIHSYKLPAIVAMPLNYGSTDYIEWVMKNTK